MQRGDIFIADLDPTIGSEQGGTRPVLVVQNNMGNKYSSTVIIAPITKRKKCMRLPTHTLIQLNGQENIVLLEQLRTISRNRLIFWVGRATTEEMHRVDNAICISLGIEMELAADLYQRSAKIEPWKTNATVETKASIVHT